MNAIHRTIDERSPKSEPGSRYALHPSQRLERERLVLAHMERIQADLTRLGFLADVDDTPAKRACVKVCKQRRREREKALERARE